MRKSSYSASPYGRMRTRMAEQRKSQKQMQKRKAESYYTWLVTGAK